MLEKLFRTDALVQILLVSPNFNVTLCRVLIYKLGYFGSTAADKSTIKQTE